MGIFDKFKLANKPLQRDEFAEAAAAIQEKVQAGGTGHDLTNVINHMMSLKQNRPGTDDLILEVLAPILVEDNHAGAAFVGVLCGAHIEGGADATIIAPNLIEGYKKALRPAKEFVQACVVQDLPEEIFAELLDEDGNYDQIELVHKHIEYFGGPLLQGNPEWANAWESLEYFGMAGRSAFISSAQARALGAADEEFKELLSFHWRIAPNVVDSHRLITMLEEDIVVLHRESGQGFRVHISGIEDNFHLHTLLGAAVNGEGKLPFDRPSAEEIAAAKREKIYKEGFDFVAVFTMVNWTQYAPNVPSPDIDVEETSGPPRGQHWIWVDDTPANIIPFQGTRVVVIEEAPYKLTWTNRTMFPDLPCQCEVVGRLSEAEVEEWFAKFAQATEV